MITADIAICRAPGLYPLCESCKRNLSLYPAYIQSAVRQRGSAQRACSPDSRPECRNYQEICGSSPEDRL